MAGWIKWQKGLTRRSEVLQIAAAVKKDRRLVACACMELWEWADDETADGFIAGCTEAFTDNFVGIRGFMVAYAAAGWATIEEGGIRLANWQRHNGATAKRRAMDGSRKDDSRTNVRNGSGQKADAKRTGVRIASGQNADQIREEKKREEQQQGFPLCAGSSREPDAVACPLAAAPAAADSCPILQALHERGIGEPTATTLRCEGCEMADIRAADKAHSDGDGPGLVVNRIRESIAGRANQADKLAKEREARATFEAMSEPERLAKVAEFRAACSAAGRQIWHMADADIRAWARFYRWLGGVD